ncbi:hypothetical protein IWZ00DRAFT_489040 [Phyllosticta capitalensis]
MAFDRHCGRKGFFFPARAMSVHTGETKESGHGGNRPAGMNGSANARSHFVPDAGMSCGSIARVPLQRVRRRGAWWSNFQKRKFWAHTKQKDEAQSLRLLPCNDSLSSANWTWVRKIQCGGRLARPAVLPGLRSAGSHGDLSEKVVSVPQFRPGLSLSVRVHAGDRPTTTGKVELTAQSNHMPTKANPASAGLGFVFGGFCKIRSYRAADYASCRCSCKIFQFPGIRCILLRVQTFCIEEP